MKLEHVLTDPGFIQVVFAIVFGVEHGSCFLLITLFYCVLNCFRSFRSMLVFQF